MLKKEEAREKRHRRIRKRVLGTEQRPRLAVFRSATHIYAQVVDDVSGRTLAASSTLTKTLRGAAGNKTDAAKAVGEAVAKVCIERGIRKVVFDRGGFVYHGRVKAVAEAARAGGLEF